MYFQFIVYSTLYLIPIWITLFTTDEKLHDVLLTVACGPSIMLFFIELV